MGLVRQLAELRAEMCRLESAFAGDIEGVHPGRRESARNLLHYVTLRRHDLRSLQDALVPLGLSSLGRAESHVLANVNAVLTLLSRLSGAPAEPPSALHPEVPFARGRELLEECMRGLFGPRPKERGVDIMVTLPSEAARDGALVRDLLLGGMDVARINCAHDEATAWGDMVGNIRRAETEVDRPCRVLMDLGGPKIRTAALAPGPRVVKWRPKRDLCGRTVAPALVWLYPEEGTDPPPAGADACLPVRGRWLSDVRQGDRIRLRDARGRSRDLSIVGSAGAGRWAETDRTGYVVPDLALELRRGGEARGEPGRIGDLPSLEPYLTLRRGDRLLLTDGSRPGGPSVYDDRGREARPASIGITMPEVLEDLRPGEPVLFDDGRIGGAVEAVHGDHAVIAIREAGPDGARLRADRGINLPETNLRCRALTQRDLKDLAFVVEHADIVGYSFVRSVEDVRRLQDEIKGLGRPEMPILLKIETRQAFEHLPRLLLAAMRSPVAGVMIARGDLAVECGFRRLAEVQEEILWMCEAAHMPVVWATQVLEQLAKLGMPSRAEISDAAMSVRAECVMLNKGPYILEALKTLDDILRRMADHRHKKRSLLRRLKLADDLLPGQL
ncbi:MAG: pyruvate kinase [Planctomycetota bacterium]